uniref:ANK_REP_REGION domain-containing protein n=1 Tax=Steinernema glaseri TaxID=37863 RepID=A0A1I8ANX4_9BILA
MADRGVKFKMALDPEDSESTRLVADNEDKIASIDGQPVITNRDENIKRNRSDLRYSPDLEPTETDNKVYSTREIDCNMYGKNGDVEGFRKEAEKFEKEAIGRRLNVVDDDLPPLHYAVRHGHLQMIRAFLQYGADPNITNKEGQTPLHFAAKYQPKYLPELLKPRGVGSPLMARRPPRLHTLRNIVPANSTIISVLLEKKATADARDNYECTPLHYAALKDNKDEARQLISIGEADVHAVELHKYTPLHLAANHGSERVAELLLQNNASLHALDERKNTPLHLACRNGHQKIVEIFLKAIDDKEDRQRYIELRNSEENSCLHLAALKGHIDVVNEIFKSEVDINVNVTRKDRITLLHLAAAKGSDTLCEKLLQQGAMVNALDIDRKSPLHFAAYHNRANIIELLVERGADLECRTKDGFTPFLTAVSENHQDAVMTLSQLGCDMAVVDVDQRSAIFLASKFNGLKILEYLLDEGGDPEMLEVFVNKQNSTYETPMHIAAANNYMEVLRLLKDKGADIRATGDDEQTPLHLACERDHIEIVRQLIDWDESVITDVDDTGNTPLHYAAKEAATQNKPRNGTSHPIVFGRVTRVFCAD